MNASGRRRKRKSCAALRRKARRIDNKRRRRKALRRLPRRCHRPPLKPKPPRPGVVIPGGTQPGTTMPAPPASGAPAPAAPQPAPAGGIQSPIAVYRGPFGPRQAERLLWRAGFGPRPGDADRLAAMGLEQAVLSLTRPAGPARLEGPAPHDEGEPLDPYGVWGHDHVWWLDRMVRSSHQLVERMALVWHDWFATSDAGVGSTRYMLEQNNVFRAHGLGSFRTLVRAMTVDPAMQLWLSALENRKGSVNENYARELMELFTLGADRGAYTEADVRELARALSGFTAQWEPGLGWVEFRFSPTRHDAGAKTIFGRPGAFGWEDACRLVCEHPQHPSFFVEKLWSYFIPDPPPAATRDRLCAVYVASGGEIRPIVEAILCAPELYEGAAMVKPPVVYTAGLLRATGQGITTGGWAWMGANAGQKLFYPPDVSGWDDERWLDTNTMAGRWTIANQALAAGSVVPSASYPAQTAAEAVAAARASLDDPPLTDATLGAIASWADTALPARPNAWERAQRFNAVRMLLAMAPDAHTA